MKNPTTTFTKVFALFSLATAVSQAATLSITSATSGNFGRVDGVYVPFENPSSTNWSPALVNTQTYTIDSVSYIKNNTDATYANLWIGVYTSYNASTDVLGGFLGASSNSVAWGVAGSGSTHTWNFSGINAEANTGNTLYLMFQTSAAQRTGQLNSGENTLALRRLPDSTVSSPAASGAGIIQGDAALRSDRAPFMDLQVTAIPEPSALLLSSLGIFALLRRRR